MLLRSWRPLLPTRLNPLRLKARFLASTPGGRDGDGDGDLAPRIRDEEEAQRFEDYFHLLPAAVKAFRERAGHFIVPFALVLPGAEDSVFNRQVVSPEWVAQGNPVNHTGVVYGLVKDVREIDWPVVEGRFMIGMCLNRLLTIQEHRVKYAWVIQELRAMGFPVDEDWEMHWWREQVLAALKVYYAMEGHSIVPFEFMVPRDDPRWPVAAWGLPLGMRVNALRAEHERGDLRPWQYDDLATVDFAFDVSEAVWKSVVLPALRVHEEVKGHCRVRYNFVVPAETPWPRPSWGYPLGATVKNIRAQTSFVSQVARDAVELDTIGFVYDYYEHEWGDRILPSLQVHAAVEGHCNIPQRFIVPSEQPWPEQAWGLPLGSIVKSMRSYGTYNKQTTRDSAQLDKIGFVWSHLEDEWREKILPSLQVFAQVEGHGNVPSTFKVPFEQPWPEKAWGLPLGNVVQSMRSRGAYKTQITRDAAQLQEIGFVWDSKQDTWDNVLLPAFQAFFQVYGHCRVPRDFIVPSGPPWPERARGSKLGTILLNITYRGDYAAQRLQDRDALEVIKFGEKKIKNKQDPPPQ